MIDRSKVRFHVPIDFTSVKLSYFHYLNLVQKDATSVSKVEVERIF